MPNSNDSGVWRGHEERLQRVEEESREMSQRVEPVLAVISANLVHITSEITGMRSDVRQTCDLNSSLASRVKDLEVVEERRKRRYGALVNASWKTAVALAVMGIAALVISIIKAMPPVGQIIRSAAAEELILPR